MKKVEQELLKHFPPIENVIAPNDQHYTANPVFIKRKVITPDFRNETIKLDSGVTVIARSYSPTFTRKEYPIAYCTLKD